MSARDPSRSVAFAAFLLLVAGCPEETTATQITLVVDADTGAESTWPAGYWIELSVMRDGEPPALATRFQLGDVDGADAFPFSLALVPREGRLGEVDARVAIYADESGGSPIVTDEGSASFEDGANVELELSLPADGVAADAGTEDAGEGVDAGTPLDASVDGGTALDAGRTCFAERVMASDVGLDDGMGFGASVAIAARAPTSVGETELVVVGAPAADAVFLFARMFGDCWVLDQRIDAPTGVGMRFGRSVAVRGSVLVVGAADSTVIFDLTSGVESGAVVPIGGGSLALTDTHVLVGDPDAGAGGEYCLHPLDTGDSICHDMVDDQPVGGAAQLGASVAFVSVGEPLRFFAGAPGRDDGAGVVDLVSCTVAGCEHVRSIAGPSGVAGFGSHLAVLDAVAWVLEDDARAVHRIDDPATATIVAATFTHSAPAVRLVTDDAEVFVLTFDGDDWVLASADDPESALAMDEASSAPVIASTTDTLVVASPDEVRFIRR